MQVECGYCDIPEAQEIRWNGDIVKLALGLLFAGQSMVFSLAINVSPPDEAGVRVAVQGLIFSATMIVVLLLGTPLLRTAVAELTRGRLTIEMLFVTTIVGALLASLQSFVTGDGPIYFEVISVLLVVYTFGKQVGTRSRASALASASALTRSLAVCRRIDAKGDAQCLLVAWSSARLGNFDARHRRSPRVAHPAPLLCACGHGLALALQGLLIVRLLDQAETRAHWTLAAFVIAGCAVGWLWYRWERIPHWLDMTIGMLTFANLGRLFGWWADLGFGPAKSCCCGHATSLYGIGMWTGMLVLGNLAMALGLRRPLQPQSAKACRWAMFGGGNVGMVFGMFLAGSYFSGQQHGVGGHLFAMSVGMIVGMLSGHVLVLHFLRLGLPRSQFAA
jgi:hypothetical protein